MADPQNAATPSQPAPAPSPDSAREGVSERGGEGGYGNDTGFATGTEAPTDGQTGGPGDRHHDGGGDANAGQSGREAQVNATYGDAGQAHGSPDATEGGAR